MVALLLTISRVLTGVVGAIVLSGCTRAPDLIGIENAEVPVASVQVATRSKIFIATTREATEVTGVFYSGERAPELGLASVVVSIPPNHVSGLIERPKRLPPDPRTEFAVIEPTVYHSDGGFIASINRELAKRPPGKREVLFFVHGYNNTISDSILRLAQFVDDTDFDGVPVLFSWASAAKASHYVYDLNSVLTARPRFLQATDLIRKTNADGFNLFAHSMGSMLTVEAIVQADLAGEYNPAGRLRNVMLAAPDIDLDLFKSQMAELNIEDRNFYIFVSQDDKALGFSRRISGGIERVGSANAAELAELGVTVIDLSEVEDSASGSHSKFAGSPEVVQLIGGSLNDNNFDARPRPPTLVEVLEGVPVLSVLTN